jgi:hypothetical protein
MNQKGTQHPGDIIYDLCNFTLCDFFLEHNFPINRGVYVCNYVCVSPQALYTKISKHLQQKDDILAHHFQMFT